MSQGILKGTVLKMIGKQKPGMKPNDILENAIEFLSYVVTL